MARWSTIGIARDHLMMVEHHRYSFVSLDDSRFP